MSDELKKWMMVLLCCLIIGTAFVSCSESITNPITPGSGLFHNDVVIKDDTLAVVSDTTFLQRIPPDGRLFFPIQQNYVGKTGNLVAYSLLRFFPRVRDTVNVLSATLKLRFTSWRGESRGTLGFTVHRANVGWNQTSTTWDTLQQTNFFESTVRGTYDGLLQSDTLIVTIGLDTAMVRDWYRTGGTNNGIVLAPTTSSTLIRGFQAFIDGDTTAKFQPELKVVMRSTAGSSVQDSLTVGADTYVANANPFPTPTDRLLSQAGIVYRSQIRFDVSRIPRGAIINTAELLMERDTALTSINRFTNTPQPSVHALIAQDSTKYETDFAVGSVRSGTSSTYSFAVRRQVQLWVNGQNYGLLLRQPDTNEYGTLDLFAFYSREAANPAARPRIIVKYTLFQ